MLGKPKYDYNDIVSFKIKMSEDVSERDYEGSVAIIDRYGTFEQNEEPSYDVYVDELRCLFKHIRESCLTYVRKGTEEESLDHLYKDPKRKD